MNTLAKRTGPTVLQYYCSTMNIFFQRVSTKWHLAALWDDNQRQIIWLIMVIFKHFLKERNINFNLALDLRKALGEQSFLV